MGWTYILRETFLLNTYDRKSKIMMSSRNVTTNIRIRGHIVEDELAYSLESKVPWDGSYAEDVKTTIALAKRYFSVRRKQELKYRRGSLPKHMDGEQTSWK